jgi:predicted nucleic acid-binding protein
VIVLDTNVVSEMMKAVPEDSVADWIAGQAEASLYITSITQAEILHGIQRLGAGKRRAALEAAAEATFTEDFAGRILSFGTDAARAYARIASQRERAGRPISQFDAQIAAITLVARATLATGDLPGFESCGIKLINPWYA